MILSSDAQKEEIAQPKEETEFEDSTEEQESE